MLYTLTFYSFSNLIRFNQKNDFNMPYGNRCYTNKHYEQMKEWYELIKNKNIEIHNENAFDILSSNIVHKEFKKNDFIYLDPPYSNTMAIYNEKRAFGGWGIAQDIQLFKILELLDKDGIKWGLSNVFENKGIKNEHLIKWCKEHNWMVYHLDYNYYSLGKGNANSDEVYICNYNKNIVGIDNTTQLSLFDL